MQKKFEHTRELESFLEAREGHIGYMANKHLLKINAELISTHTHRYINIFLKKALMEFEDEILKRTWEIEAEYYEDLKKKAKREMADYLCE